MCVLRTQAGLSQWPNSQLPYPSTRFRFTPGRIDRRTSGQRRARQTSQCSRLLRTGLDYTGCSLEAHVGLSALGPGARCKVKVGYALLVPPWQPLIPYWSLTYPVEHCCVTLEADHAPPEHFLRALADEHRMAHLLLAHRHPHLHLRPPLDLQQHCRVSSIPPFEAPVQCQ